MPLVTLDLLEGRPQEEIAAISDSATEAKQGFYRRLCELLVERVGMSPEDLAVVMVENERADWSFGLGEASYLERPPEAWR